MNLVHAVSDHLRDIPAGVLDQSHILQQVIAVKRAVGTNADQFELQIVAIEFPNVPAFPKGVTYVDVLLASVAKSVAVPLTV